MSSVPLPTTRSRIRRLVVIAGIAYVALLPLLLACENVLAFPGATFARPWREPPSHHRVTELSLPSADGNVVRAWFSAPDGWTPRAGAVLYSHGNGSNLSRISGRAFRWRDPFGRAVLIYDYPGYGRSTGRPTEAGCYAAGEAALAWLTAERSVPVGEVILVGESIGGAVAVELASKHRVRMLVLHGAFTSFAEVAQLHVPIYPTRYLVRNRMDNEAKMPRVTCPVVIAHGSADGVVPIAQAERLYAAATGPKRFVRLLGHGHGPPKNAEFFGAVRRLLGESSLGCR